MFLLSQITSSGDASTLTSIGAVMLATTLVIQGLVKPYVSNLSIAKRVPVIFYTIAVALLLTIFANKVLHTLSGGSIWSLLWQSLISVLGAAGIYHLPGSTQAIEDTTQPPTPPTPPAAPLKMAAVLILGLMFIPGCAILGTGSPTTQPSTPAQNLAVVEQGYSIALAAVNLAVETGRLSPADAAKAAPYLNAVEASLNAAEADVAAGKSTTQVDIDAAVAALNQLAPILAKVKTPTTQPI